jgi:hypothetical protein
MLFSGREYYAQLVESTCYLVTNATTPIGWAKTECRSDGDSYAPCWSTSVDVVFNVSVPVIQGTMMVLHESKVYVEYDRNAYFDQADVTRRLNIEYGAHACWYSASAYGTRARSPFLSIAQWFRSYSTTPQFNYAPHDGLYSTLIATGILALTAFGTCSTVKMMRHDRRLNRLQRNMQRWRLAAVTVCQQEAREIRQIICMAVRQHSHKHPSPENLVTTPRCCITTIPTAHMHPDEKTTNTTPLRSPSLSPSLSPQRPDPSSFSPITDFGHDTLYEPQLLELILGFDSRHIRWLSATHQTRHLNRTDERQGYILVEIPSAIDDRDTLEMTPLMTHVSPYSTPHSPPSPSFSPSSVPSTITPSTSV